MSEPYHPPFFFTAAPWETPLAPVEEGQPSVWGAWPDTLPAGERSIGPFVPCAGCRAGTWTRYGGIPYCRVCAKHDQASSSPPDVSPVSAPDSP